MKSTTHNNRVVVGLAIIGFTLMIWPLSVFSQSTISESDITEGTSTPVILEDLYSIESLPDPDGSVIGDFVVGPGKVELTVEPGETKTVELMVSNRMGETKNFKLEVEDAAGSSDPAKPVVLLGNDIGPYTLKDYIQVPEVEFELEHMKRARIPVTISLPPDAEAGGRYGSVVVSTVSREADLEGTNGAAPSSAIISRIGTLFFISTPGSTDVAGALESFTTLPEKSLFWSGPVSFGLVFNNTGSVHLNPYGEISVSNMLGEEVGFMELDPWFALPQSLRTREVSWNKSFLAGRYTAVAQINRGYDDVIDKVVISFWVIPYKLVGGVFIGFFVLFLGLRFLTSRFELQRKV